MPDLKISALPVATTPLAGTELVPVVQSATTKQTTVGALMTSTVPSGTANGVLYLNGSKVATSGTALAFNGTSLTIGSGSGNPFARINGGASAGQGGGYAIDRNGTEIGGVYSGSWYTSGSAAVNTVALGTTTAEALLFGINYSEQMRLTSTGLGIGTSSPANKLHVTVSAASTAAAAIYNTDASNGNGVYIKAGGSNSGKYALAIDNAAGTSLALLDSSGNLGLGVTPSAWALTGLQAFQVKNGALYGFSGDEVGVTANCFYDTAIGGWKYISTGSTATRYRQNAGIHSWFTAPSGTAGNAISFTQAMTLDASGNVQIGTASSDGYRLRTYGTTQLTSGYQLTYGGVGAATVTIASGGALVFGYDASTGSTERARITSGGDLLITSTGGLGYGTGSGGAVTQITSRTTGVTLNKTNGAITLVSAAGTATWQSFTVTNSTVAATDTVIVNQKSGTDLYQIFVTAVAAGSFDISFATTGGTTTEQPVFNFAVIKAVTA